MKNIVVFASGKGSNAANIIQFFSKSNRGKVVAIFSNNSASGAIAAAKENQIAPEVFLKTDLASGDVLNRLKKYSPSLIVLAGFLLKVPTEIIQQYAGKIINLHPSLLPKYGGKGMYGMHVHRAVLAHGEKETGITIHFVDENYDQGKIIAQYKLSIKAGISPEELARQINEMERVYLPQVILNLL